MAIYELINPHDPYTLEAPSDAVAAAACLLLGGGMYGLKREDGTAACPTFAFVSGPADLEARVREWWGGLGVGSPCDFVEANKAQVADALDSVLVGDPKFVGPMRAAINMMPTDLGEVARRSWHDDVRTSTCDVGRAAWQMAKEMREGKA